MSLGCIHSAPDIYLVNNVYGYLCILCATEGLAKVCFCLFVCFVALRPKSTAMVMAGRSIHLTTLFPGQA